MGAFTAHTFGEEEKHPSETTQVQRFVRFKQQNSRTKNPLRFSPASELCQAGGQDLGAPDCPLLAPKSRDQAEKQPT